MTNEDERAALPACLVACKERVLHKTLLAISSPKTSPIVFPLSLEAWTLEEGRTNNLSVADQHQADQVHSDTALSSQV